MSESCTAITKAASALRFISVDDSHGTEACRRELAAIADGLLDAADDCHKEIERLRANKVSRTYGELPDPLKSLIEPHEWDNKNISEQRDWAVAKLARLQARLQILIDGYRKDADNWTAAASRSAMHAQVIEALARCEMRRAVAARLTEILGEKT